MQLQSADLRHKLGIFKSSMNRIYLWEWVVWELVLANPQAFLESVKQKLSRWFQFQSTIQKQTHNSANDTNLYQSNIYGDLKTKPHQNKTNCWAINTLMAAMIIPKATVIRLT